MRSVRGIYLLAISLVSFLNLKAQVEDSAFVMYQKDSAIIPETDPTTLFFQEGEKTTIPDKILIVTKSRKTLPLTKLLKGIYTATGQWVGAQTDSMDSYIEYTFADLDNDGKKEFSLSIIIQVVLIVVMKFIFSKVLRLINTSMWLRCLVGIPL